MFIPQQKINIVATAGALGDTCATLPTLKLLFDRGHIEKLFVDHRYIGLYRLYFGGDILVDLKDAVRIVPACDMTPDIPRNVIDPLTGEACYLDYPLNPNIPTVKSMQPYPTSVHSELVDCFSLALCDAILRPEQKNYPLVDKDKLPVNPLAGVDYAVVAYGATTEHRRMLPEILDGITKYFRMRNTEVVLIGKRDHELQCNGVMTRPTFDAVPPECINLIDQTSIPEALAIMRDARMVIGLDNGLIHLAALTDVRIVAGYTTVDPFYRLPYRHNVKGWNCSIVEPDSACKYCQTETFCTYGLDFLKCQTRTLECMKSLTLNPWLRAIKEKCT